MVELYQQAPALVWLAIAVNAGASLAAAHMLARPLRARRPPEETDARRGWIQNAAVVFGCGMWSAHILLMLAFRTSVPTFYDPVAVAASLVIAIGGTVIAFSVARPRDNAIRRHAVLLGGATLGVTIYAEQFIRLASLRLPGLVLVDPIMRLASLITAIVLAITAMLALHAGGRPTRRQGWSPGQIGAALVFFVLVLLPPFVALSGSKLTRMTVVETTAADLNTALESPLIHIVLAIACGGIVAIAGAAMVLDRRRARRQQESRRLRHFADGTFEGILIHRDGVILDVNAALCALLCRQADDLIGRHLLAGIVQQDHERVRQRLASGDVAPAEFTLATDAGPRLVEVLAREIEHDGRPARMVAVRDLTERRATEDRLRFLAHHDSLTGLANRTLLNERLTQALALADRQEHVVAVLALDLDRFKLVNDLMGHNAGDAVLREVARRLQGCARSIDTLARVGGDEFVIIQPAIGSIHAAEALARRVIAAISQPFDIERRPVSIGTSVGIALFPSDSREPHELLKQADIALYRSKSGGRGTLRCFEPGMNAQLIERRQHEQALRRALRDGTLSLHYQVRYSCATGVATGCEAVLHWDDQYGVPGIEPLRVAEECGLSAELGAWMLRHACRDAQHWPARLRVAINLASGALHRPGLVAQVTEALRESGLSAARLDLQIGGNLNHEADHVHEVLRGLKALGLQLSLDDFGTCAASLSLLRRFPFQRVKIDHSLIAGIGTDTAATEIVRAILALSHTLRLDVCAEGVATREQFDLLRREGCSEVQGSLLSPPMPPPELRAMLRETMLLQVEVG